MANSTIEKNQAHDVNILNNTKFCSDVVVTETVVGGKINAQITAFTGTSWVNIGGSAITPTVPNGYTFVGNVNVVTNGVGGLVASFDGSNQFTSQSVNPYLFNATSTAVAKDKYVTIRLYSICKKIAQAN